MTEEGITAIDDIFTPPPPPSPSSTIIADSTVYTSQSVKADYITTKGIENRIGVEAKSLPGFIAKEVLDNSTDYLETQHVKKPEIVVVISQTDTYLQIKVSNSSNGQQIFTKDRIRSIFNFDRVLSSKRNQYKITRGALGDAFKEIISAPYALARDSGRYRNNNSSNGEWDEPLIIRNNNKMFNIRLINFQPKIEEFEPLDLGTPSHEQEFETKRNLFGEVDVPATDNNNGIDTYKIINIIEVEARLPLVRIIDPDTVISRLKKFLENYAILNPHIGFTFFIQGQYAKRLPATQPILPNWSNQTSIHYYKDLQEFEDFIVGLEGGKEQDERKIFDVLYNIRFREISNLSKSTNFLQKTLGELKQDHTYIEEIYNSLLDKKITKMDPPTTLSLPFSTKYGVRKKAIEDRIKQLRISCQLVKYKQKFSTYSLGDQEDHEEDEEEGNSQVPSFYETTVVHSDAYSIPGSLYVVEPLNSSTMPNNYLVFYGSHEDTFRWKKKDGSGKKKDEDEEDDEEDDNKFHKGREFADILRKYDYSYENKGRKRHSIVVANLICPRINYRNYGKSFIDVLPFADTIAEVTAKACSGGGGRDKDKKQLAALRQVLMKRKNEYLSTRDPVERKKKEWTQSDVFYATRKLLVTQYGYTDQEVNREHITGSIRDECAKLGVTREQIGIIAADRAQLYFKGKWTDVGLDEVEEQVEYGTDMVMIEKEGIVSQICLFADKNAIALLNTRGFFVEYASKLARLSDEKGCNVSLLVDWDVSGLLIFLKVRRIIPGVKRIGVDFKTVEDLGLRAADVEEKYTPDKGHLKSLKKELAEAIELARREFGPESTMEIEYDYIKMRLDYLEEKRIEINSIVSELHDNARFWNWVEEQLRDCFSDRDFMRSVNIPDYVEPMPLQKLNDIIRQKGTAVLKPRKEELEDKLSNNNIENAFLFDRTNEVQQLANYDISDYEKALTRQSQKIIENSDKVKPYLKKIEELLKQVESENNKKNTNNKSNEDINQN